MTDEVLFEIGEMLQKLVDFWKNSDKEYAEYYVDAYLSVQANIRGILRSSARRTIK